MKFFVEVNARYLISMEADTALSAEHAILDLDGAWGAMAFDAEMQKSETFHGVLLSCSTISLEEFTALSCGYADMWKKAGRLQEEFDRAAAEERRLHEMLEAAIEARKAAAAAAGRALENARSWQREVMNITEENRDPRAGRQ